MMEALIGLYLIIGGAAGVFFAAISSSYIHPIYGQVAATSAGIFSFFVGLVIVIALCIYIPEFFSTDLPAFLRKRKEKASLFNRLLFKAFETKQIGDVFAQGVEVFIKEKISRQHINNLSSDDFYFVIEANSKNPFKLCYFDTDTDAIQSFSLTNIDTSPLFFLGLQGDISALYCRVSDISHEKDEMKLTIHFEQGDALESNVFVLEYNQGLDFNERFINKIHQKNHLGATHRLSTEKSNRDLAHNSVNIDQKQALSMASL